MLMMLIYQVKTYIFIQERRGKEASLLASKELGLEENA
jgi:hypothetical protein